MAKAERQLAEEDLELAARVKVHPALDARLVRISADDDLDEFHVLQCLEDVELGEEEQRFWAYQRYGRTGTPGDIKKEGPRLFKEVEEVLHAVFLEKTGAAWGDLEPGARVPDGKFWVQKKMAQRDLKARWEYYVGDFVDSKAPGWYPYEEAAGDQVEEIYAQHEANSHDDRTANRVISSGYFSYRVNLGAMTQENTKTKKVREIRRVVGDRPDSKDDPELPKFAKKAKKAEAMKAEVEKAKAKRGPKAKAKVPRPPPKAALGPHGPVKVLKKGMKPKKEKAPKAEKVKKVPKVKAEKAKKEPKAKPEKKKKEKTVAKGKGAYKLVMAGKAKRTAGNKKKEDLMKNRKGKIVTKKFHAKGLRVYQRNLKAWHTAFKAAKAALGLTGQWATPKKGTPLYEKTKEILAGGPGAAAALLKKGSSKALIKKKSTKCME